MSLQRNRTRWRDDLSRVTWQNFESLLADHYRRAGYNVEHCGTGGSGSRYDGGVDLVLRRDGETVLVQAKHWNANQCPHNAVHELLGIVETRAADRAILITSGEFTAAARDAASRSSRIELLDGADLRRLVDPRLIPVQLPAPGAPRPSHADQMDWQPVVEKSVDAVINVMSGRAPWRRRRSFREELVGGAVKLVFGLIVFFVAMFFIRHQLEKVKVALAPPDRPARATVATPPPSRVAASGPASQSERLPNGIQRMTDEETAEWERKNREAMKILERTTPELQR